MRRKTQVRLASALVITVLGLGLTSCYDNMYPTANARTRCVGRNHYNDDGATHCQTDNRNFTYGLTSGSSADHQAITSVLEQQFEPTDLQVSRQTPIRYTGTAETDVVFQVGATLPQHTGGITWCNNASSSIKCDQHYVRLRTSFTRALVCHETGHAVGLVHGDRAEPRIDNEDDSLGCLRTPSEFWFRELGPHNRNMINDTY